MKTRRQITPEEVALVEELQQLDNASGSTPEQAAHREELRAKVAEINASLAESEKDVPPSEEQELADLDNAIALTEPQAARRKELKDNLSKGN